MVKSEKGNIAGGEVKTKSFCGIWLKGDGSIVLSFYVWVIVFDLLCICLYYVISYITLFLPRKLFNIGDKRKQAADNLRCWLVCAWLVKIRNEECEGDNLRCWLICNLICTLCLKPDICTYLSGVCASGFVSLTLFFSNLYKSSTD
jgi:hypothetical protein